MKASLAKLWPKSLYAQLLLVAAVALLVAQLLNAYLLLNGLRARADIEAGTALVGSYTNRLERAQARGEKQIRATGPGGTRARRRAVVYFESNSALPGRGFKENRALANRAIGFIQEPETDSLNGADFRLSSGRISDLPIEVRNQVITSAVFLRLIRLERPAPRRVLLLSVRQGDDAWMHAALPVRQVERSALFGLIWQTMLLYVAVLIPLALVARRVSRPLKNLQNSMQRFGDDGNIDQLKGDGPQDVRDLIGTYNNLQQRIGQLLSEKDVMLGAIGHDLKTPLASLRVRIETVDDVDERTHMAASIDEMAAILDDILTLARLGKSGEELQVTDIAALVDTVLDDFSEDALQIDFKIPESRITAPIRPMLLRRTLRNIIGNALRYAGQARISLRDEVGFVTVIVDDDGPGVPPDQIEDMFEPFVRAESSRNRASGGSGLGLTIARAIARAHGGDVQLRLREGGGLQAAISVAQRITPNAQ